MALRAMTTVRPSLIARVAGFVRRVDPPGAIVAANPNATADDGGVSVASAGTGRFLVAWQSSPDGVEEPDVLARWFDGNGVPASAAFRVNSESGGQHGRPKVAGRPDGHAAVAWRNNVGLGGSSHARIYGPDGLPKGPELTLRLHRPPSS